MSPRFLLIRRLSSSPTSSPNTKLAIYPRYNTGRATHSIHTKVFPEWTVTVIKENNITYKAGQLLHVGQFSLRRGAVNEILDKVCLFRFASTDIYTHTPFYRRGRYESHDDDDNMIKDNIGRKRNIDNSYLLIVMDLKANITCAQSSPSRCGFSSKVLLDALLRMARFFPSFFFSIVSTLLTYFVVSVRRQC
jgi:hypothetical protein